MAIKQRTYLIIFIAVMALLSSVIGATIRHFLNKEKEEYTRNVGKKIVIDGQTLTIVDYSTILENYQLSNGMRVDKSFVENQSK